MMRWVELIRVPGLMRRMGHGLLVLLGVSVLTFLFSELAPGDPFSAMRLDPTISGDSVDALRDRLGLDRSLPARYLGWLRSVVSGDLGFSVAYSSPVAPLIWPRVRNTLLLTVSAMVISWLFAVPLGLWAATRRGRSSRRDRLSQWIFDGGTSLLLAVPDLLLGLCLLFLAVRSGLLPAGGMVSTNFESLTAWGRLKDLAAHGVVPLTALILTTLPMLARHVRASAAEVMDSRFLLAARGLGLPRHRLLWRYALPVAANPLITLFGFSLGSLLSASLLIEVITSWPGLGPLLLGAILARDVHVVMATVLLATVFLILGNLFADALLYRIDPRIRDAS